MDKETAEETQTETPEETQDLPVVGADGQEVDEPVAEQATVHSPLLTNAEGDTEFVAYCPTAPGGCGWAAGVANPGPDAPARCPRCGHAIVILHRHELVQYEVRP